MPIYLLTEDLAFPNPADADPSGILAVGGDLSPGRLLLGYSLGIFPWYDENTSPILWHAPPERMVLLPDELHIGRTVRRLIRRGTFEIRYDTAFEQVIQACASTPRPGQDGTWLNFEMRSAYLDLHRRGYAHSAEAFLDGKLVGGLYGITIGSAFFGESMFSHAANASKVVFTHCVLALKELGFDLVDCQVYTDHLAKFGAKVWPRHRFQRALKASLKQRPERSWPRST